MKERSRYFLKLFTFYFLLLSLFGCDAFVRKFTRKKKTPEPREEMVLIPEEYKSNMTKDELYRQYFLFWQSWQDELIESLNRSGNHKKQVNCVEQAIGNLTQAGNLLNQAKKAKLGIYLNDLVNLQAEIKTDVHGNSFSGNRQSAERVKMRIMREFAYPKVKDSLI